MTYLVFELALNTTFLRNVKATFRSFVLGEAENSAQP